MSERFDYYRDLIERALAAAFAPAQNAADGLREAMRYSLTAGGKRIRPCLCLEFGRLCGAEPEKLLPVACGVEMLHTYSLIHDDLPCMDDDDERRGRPACHKAFGETTAVLAGDCLQAEAFASVCRTEAAPADIARCCGILARAAGLPGICGGQYMDLNGGADTAERLSATELLKTASLMGAACAMGAAAAGAPQSLVDAADAFGMALGMAFQCRDDYLDGDGFCALLGREKCLALTQMYTEQALAMLGSFDDTEDLRALARSLSIREN